MKTNKLLCLITPPSPFLLDERVFMHIGILKVAASLEDKGYFVDFLDLAGIANCEEVLDTYLKHNPLVRTFGLTATTPQMPSAFKISQYLREFCLGSKVILGGTHPSLMHSAMKKEKTPGRATKDIQALLDNFDVIVAGDGEKAIFEALDIDKGIVDADVPKGGLFLTNQELEDLPLPARHLVDVDSYH